jgi:hypothetical protein
MGYGNVCAANQFSNEIASGFDGLGVFAFALRRFLFGTFLSFFEVIRFFIRRL